MASGDRLPISLLGDDGVTRFDVMYVLSYSPVAHVWRVVC